jgi:predicted nucleic acid-binding protein
VPHELTGEARLGKGEREAIALAQQYQSLLLVDEVYARSVAARMGIETVGSLGILVEAYRKGNLTPGVLEELLHTMERREDIWIHPDLCRRVRREIPGEWR